jgi:hypothetical protein
MDLLAYSSEVAKVPSLRDVRSSAILLWDQAYRIIGNESRTDPTVAAVLSQIVLGTEEFSLALERHHLDPTNESSREVILISRSNWGEYVLLVADDNFDAGNRVSGAETLRFGEASIERALWKWQKSLEDQPRKRGESEELLSEIYRTLSPAELIGIDRFTVYFVKRPRRVQTSAPIPAWEITSSGIKGRATAGCIVKHASGSSGVTSVRHFFPFGPATGTIISVEGSPGTVVGEDLMSDSVYIRMPFVPAPATRRGVKGWLKGVSPRIGEMSMFDGATSHKTPTAVTGHDPGVTQYSPYRQSRVYTPPVTNPGDSGAALIEDSTDLIIGFAKERTEAGALIEWSSWIWADSVFTALSVNPE